ncbi:MAG: serine/threonine-protein kinase, partial [Verrucomicrobiota bacterium]
MSTTRTCDRCGTVVPASAPDNLCLRCLFDTAVDLDADTSGEQAPAKSTIRSIEQTTPPPIFGDYELLGELGRGGQGVVYRARHRGLGRLVALKTIPPVHLAGTHARERFRLEASTASRLDHPNIVPIYEVGERDGFCFYSMKLVEGTTIQQLISHDLPDASACRHIATILVKVAHAVHHAHQRGVLHRDLKPSNVLLDLEHQPHVSDFGLARQTDEDSSLTLSQALIGTPAYLAPEVAMGGARQATVAADIYGLGAIIFQLLTGRPPFVGATVAETLRAVQDAEPARPVRLNPAVAADLETICLKCLQKEPTKRYVTAEALADDLARFLRDEPIHARPVTRAEHAWRWCRRKPALASFVAATALLLLAILVGSPLAAYRINQLRKAEQMQLGRAEAESLKARQFAYASDMNSARYAVQEDDFYRALQLLDRHRPEFEVAASAGSTSDHSLAHPDRLKAELQTDLRSWEWRYLWRQCQGEERFILGEHTGGASAVGMLADGKTVFSAGNDKFVRLWDFKSRRQVGLLPHSEAVVGAAASPDGRWLATATENDTKGQPVLLWDLATQKIADHLTTTTSNFTNFWLRPGSISFSPDSKWLAFATMWGGVRIWDVAARREVTNLSNLSLSGTTEGTRGLVFSPDSSTLAYNQNENGVILLWDIASRSVIGSLTGHQSAVTALAFS